ncbi:MAG: DUF2400 family protein [Ferruginibacter sp.]
MAFGIRNKIKHAHMIRPCDLQPERATLKLNLITRKQTDWQTAIELTPTSGNSIRLILWKTI